MEAEIQRANHGNVTVALRQSSCPTQLKIVSKDVSHNKCICNSALLLVSHHYTKENR